MKLLQMNSTQRSWAGNIMIQQEEIAHEECSDDRRGSGCFAGDGRRDCKRAGEGLQDRHEPLGGGFFDQAPGNFDGAWSVDATIDVSTVSTGIAARDTHLKSADFFEVAKFPTMTFKSTSVVKAGDHYDLKGDLTMHGVTKTVTLRMDPPSKAMPGNPGRDGKVLVHYGFAATTTINRKEFGLLWDGSPTSTGDKLLSDDVKVEIDIDAAG